MKNEMPYSAWKFMRDDYGYEEALFLYYGEALKHDDDLRIAYQDLIKSKRMIDLIMAELANKED